MDRVFDPIDIIFIVLIVTYLLALFGIILVLVYGKKPTKRYKVVEVISKPKKKKRKTTVPDKKVNKDSKTKKKINNSTNSNIRYKGKAATKKKTAPRKKKPKTNGINKKRKK